MNPRLKYHFEPQKGWINDPNGLVFFKGRYHAFFQHNPHSIHWDKMHWGHAVSDDLINWEELPIALYPDKPYENSGGCFSGSAVVKDGRLYLFYTSVSDSLGQTQSLAYTDDGVTFTKYEGNPIISENPFGREYNTDFRDPKVSLIDGKYYMVVGTGINGEGKVLLFTSADLISWEYSGFLFDAKEYTTVVECPDFFKLDDKYVLMFSRLGTFNKGVTFVLGDFDGKTFTAESVQFPESGPHFYAPQTFSDGKRRIIIGWLHYSWDTKTDADEISIGAFTIPREITIKDGTLKMYPIKEARHLLKDIGGNTEVLRDENCVEIFINKGEFTSTMRV